MSRLMVGTALLAVVALWDADPLRAQGSSVYTQGACVSGRGGAAVATPCPDASSIYYNPAAIAASPSAISAGFSLIRNTGAFTYDSTGVEVAREVGMPVVPQIYASYRMGDRWAAGLGFFAPYGLGIEWPETFEGRFISWKSELQSLFLQPTVAWRLTPELSLGAGVDVVFGSLELNRGLDGPVENDQLLALGVPLGTDIARARLTGSDVGLGGHVGVYYQPSSRFAVGARYMHSVTLNLEGDATFEQVATGRTVIIPDPETGDPTPVPLDALVAPQFGPGAPLSDQDVSAELTLPPQAVVGVRVGVGGGLAVSADYQWTGWSSFDRIVADFQRAPDLPLELEYEDTHGIRVGTEYQATRALDLRAGFVYNTAASPDQSVTPILPEAERHNYAVGVGYDFGGLRADAYYSYVRQADRRGRVRSEIPGVTSPEALNVGVYTSTVNIFGLTLAYPLGGTP